ncbi:uncharacterized protein LOC123522974 [Mercenaria mercenaria]|uniref:uncharacterized protein LOC123522974 n=1 Tax=Mercenaria mercenaria TaxID=6596 RepID=UPI00234E9532|nr:uncharacterized protein LOC123522974 [Mercenaria mercenaria]
MSEYSLFLALVLLCVQHVKSSDKNESRDFILKKSVEDYEAFCPYTDLCYHPARKNITRAGNGTHACCHSCNCDVSCGTACCPDKPERFLNETEILKLKSAPEQCVYAQLRPFSSNKLNGVPFNMIGNCPVDYTNEYINGKCSREYHEFNFGQEDTQTLMPLSSNTMNITFKNYYCAICHNVVNTNLQFWNTEIVCANKKKLLLSNISEILLKLSEEPWCQVIFEPSFTTQRYDVKRCSGVIDRCNVTGSWYQYDYALETACMSYTSEYKGFKNIHCFLCNGNTLKDEDGICEPNSKHQIDISFLALLDFYDLDGSSLQSKVTKCSSGSKYDPLKDVCRPLRCASGMRLYKNRCSSLYPEMVFLDNSVVFSLHFNLIPTHIAARGDSELLMNLVHSVLSQFIPKIDMIHTANDAEICAFNVYLKLQHSLENTVMLMNRDNLTEFMQFVSYLSFAVDFSIEGIWNISAVIEEMATIYATNDYYAQYTVQYPSDDTEMPAIYRNNTSEEYINNLNQLHLDPSQHLMFLSGQNDPDDGLGILWFVEDALSPMQRCESVLSIQPNPFCPRIELQSNEFNIDITSKKVSNLKTYGVSKSLPFTFFFSKMLTSKNEENVLVCADEYFSQLPTKNVSTVTHELAVLTIICLVCSIISLLLTFFVYCFLPSLRTLPGLNNMALVVHLFLFHTLLLVTDVTDINNSRICSAVGIGLHYTLLTYFFWMCICTFHMLNVFVKIKERSAYVHTMKKFVHYLIFAESMSAILVICHIVVAVVSADGAVSLGYGGSTCFIWDPIMLLCFVFVPLGLVLVANMLMFSYVIWCVSRLPDMAESSNQERHTLLILTKLSTLTGITWIFGYVYIFTDSLLFTYAFIIFNAGQGVFIMFSFVINKRVFDMMHSQIHKKTNGQTKETNHTTSNSIASVNGAKNITITMSDNTDTKF